MALPIIQDNELRLVQKPAQYLGGELGSVVKDEGHVELRVCLAFPDTYEVGMSHIGMQILYDLINRDERLWAERAYVPLADMEELLRKKNAPLCSLESKRPLSEFDVVGMSLQYELCQSGILGLLDLGGIPLLSVDRTEGDPIVIGGGPVSYHPEPFADFFDCFLIGDGEELVPEFLEAVRAYKQQGLAREEILYRLRTIGGVYIPKFFEPQYDERGKFLGMNPRYQDYTEVQRRIIPSLEGAPFPEKPVVPNIETVHNRLAVEVMRGCVRGCRFCQAGYLYRPQRERSPEEIISLVENSLKSTGYEELSLLSLSTADYCSILPLLSAVKEKFATDDKLAISFPSTRVDALKPELLKEVQQVRRSGFTIAPEAGTQRLRDVINKGVTEEELFDTCRNVFKLGWSSIKMYFMIGLPTETDEDVEGIIELGRKVKQIAGRRNQVTVSVSTHVPKPHTPFQWAEQITPGEILRKQRMLFEGLKRYGISFRYHNASSTFLEGVFARGDRQLSKVILHAYTQGARLDGWIEELSPEIWDAAFEACGIDPYHYLHERAEDDALPWDHIDCDIPKRWFLKEWKRASAARVTPDCLTQTCSTCGACDYDATRNVLFDRQRTESRLNIVNPPWQKIIDKREENKKISLLEDEDIHSDDILPETGARAERSGSYELKEYLRTETDSQRRPGEALAHPVAQRMRLRYSKDGVARFTSHLELATVMFRTARRADIPIAYSRGFNPRPKFSFGPPSQLGLSSIHEFVDIFLYSRSRPEEIVSAFNEQLPEGIQIESAKEIAMNAESIQSIIARQHYTATPLVENGFDASLDNWEEISVTRVRKKKTRTVRLGDCIQHLEYKNNSFSFIVDHTGVRTLKPFEVLKALTGFGEEAFEVTKINVEFRPEA